MTRETLTKEATSQPNRSDPSTQALKTVLEGIRRIVIRVLPTSTECKECKLRRIIDRRSILASEDVSQEQKEVKPTRWSTRAPSSSRLLNRRRRIR